MAFTYFFRDMRILKAIEQHVIPRIKCRRYMDIWDAGCATGQEPYSLAILFRENMGEFLFRNVRIYASDSNGSFAEQVQRAIYPGEQVKRVPAEYRNKYFKPADRPDHFVLVEALRKAVIFLTHDLTTLTPIRQGLSLVVCKNVLLHLNPDQRIEVLRMFRDALCDGGFLAVEQTQELPEEARRWFRQPMDGVKLFQRC